MKKVNNNIKSEQPDIEYLVLKNFIAVIKKHGMYQMFRSVVGNNTNNVVSKMYGKMNSFNDIIQRQSRDNMFRNAANIDAFIDMMKASIEGRINRNEEDPAKIQHYIANCTNMLIHVFIERNIRDFSKLGKLGEEVFTISCREMFGGDFEDLLPEPPKKVKMLNQMISDGIMPRLTPEMIAQMRHMFENNNQPRQFEIGDAHTPIIEQDDLDFLDNLLNGAHYIDDDDDYPLVNEEIREEDDINWDDDEPW